jgi:hemolysin activation/secretion protein
MRNLKFLLVFVGIVFLGVLESSENNFKKLEIEKESNDLFFEDVNYEEKCCGAEEEKCCGAEEKCPKDESKNESEKVECPEDEPKNLECPEDEEDDKSDNSECPEDESENSECPEDTAGDKTDNPECREDEKEDESENVACPNDEPKNSECPVDEEDDKTDNPECPECKSNDESDNTECPEDEEDDESEKVECPNDEPKSSECPEDEEDDKTDNTEYGEDESDDESSNTECSEKEKTKKEFEIPTDLKLKAIVIVGNEKILKLKDFEDEEGVFFEGSGNKRLLKEKLSKYLSKPFPAKEGIGEIKKEIVSYYKNQNMPLVIVNVPPQDITNGILRFIVAEARLGKVKVIGNKYFRAHQYKNKISLEKGDCIDEKVLLKNINFLNKNPYRKVDMIYTPGEKEYTTDVELLTHENRPFRVYYGTENTGLDLTGKNRYLAGVSVGNLFRLGHVFSYQIIRSYQSHRFQAHTFQYTLPLWWQHRILLYGGFSDIKADIPVFKTGRNKGDSYQGSFRYEAPFTPFNFFTHDFTFGFDFKRTNNSLFFAENLPRYGSLVNLTQIMAGYSLKCLKGIYQSSVDLEIFYSPVRC